MIDESNKWKWHTLPFITGPQTSIQPYVLLFSNISLLENIHYRKLLLMNIQICLEGEINMPNEYPNIFYNESTQNNVVLKIHLFSRILLDEQSQTLLWYVCYSAICNLAHFPKYRFYLILHKNLQHLTKDSRKVPSTWRTSSYSTWGWY